MVILALLLIVQMPAVSANTLNDLKGQKNEIEQQKSNITNSINETTSEIKANENRQQEILAQIEALDKKIVQTNEEIDVVIEDIKVANQEIAELEEAIAELEGKIEARDELLRERMRAVQANGTVSYLDVLLGANSFVDFIDRFSAVSTLMEADRQIMRDQKRDIESLEEQKLLLENKKKKLEENQAELERLRASLDAQKKDKNKLIDELEREQEKLKKDKQLLEAEYSEALQVSEELQKKIVTEQNRLAEIARQQELQRRREMANNNIPVVSSGTWTKPTNGRLTSGYGWRNIGFGTEFHYGVDIANATGTPIVAATDGVVSYAGPLSTYGNVVILTHSIDGQIFTTVYAHLSGFNVGVGETVSKGQRIASMGSTGRSTGPHLHFEIHIGPWRGQSVGSVNPLRYIPL
ncbi:peptidoglycan DD-metalloendopeptidase family protein [Metasolibacillus meyeri]|uniref:Peptidoglycan DD-metalloendopeptidase family protein n=2 Tax=Metasolibacillus meyeri TaxID=1071052 RepID=A0AAW9NS82_9BACL|nr:peptidoglycan DD-metalloendopeptidase family protein [Metasolibacillus meyeri]MEC1178843.1 peptidoglycan DD-metalloendopeptidase family protein [Metasolibacillus meyeri]